MIGRVIAWVFVLGLGWGASHVIGLWSSPWTVPVSPIMSVLPDQPDGCGEKCK